MVWAIDRSFSNPLCWGYMLGRKLGSNPLLKNCKWTNESKVIEFFHFTHLFIIFKNITLKFSLPFLWNNQSVQNHVILSVLDTAFGYFLSIWNQMILISSWYQFPHQIIEQYFGFNDASSSSSLPNARLVSFLHALEPRMCMLIPIG